MHVIFAIILMAFSGAIRANNDNATQLAKVEEISAMYGKAEWTEVIPLKGMAYTLSDCDKLSAPCEPLRKRIKSVADGFAACDQPSKLCAELAKVLASDFDFVKPFRDGKKNISLPDHPFYISLNNELLDTWGKAYGYRTEMLSDWWARWYAPILSSIFCTVFVSALYLFVQRRIENFRLEVLHDSREEANARFDTLVNGTPLEPKAIVFWIDEPNGHYNMMHVSRDQFQAMDKKLVELILKANAVENIKLGALKVEIVGTGIDPEGVPDELPVLCENTPEPITDSMSDQLAKELEKNLNG